MSRAMWVQGFADSPPESASEREVAAIDLSFGCGERGVTDTDDEPDAVGCVLVEVAKLDPSIRFLRIYCL